MNLRWWKRESEIERLLRAQRPKPSERLLSQFDAPSLRRTVPRPVLAGILSATMLVGIAGVGGISYAASTITQLVHRSKVDFGHKLTVQTRLVSSAAADQYGNVQVSGNVQQQQGNQGQSGQVNVQSQGGGSQGATQVAVKWASTTFAAPVTVYVDPTPPTITSTALVGGGNQIVSIVVTDTAGQAVHTLSSPIDVTFANAPAGFVPVISEDGINYRAVPHLSGPTLPDGQPDGYFTESNGTVHILTRHLTVFAVLYKANVNVSETGKKTPQAGSGLFGDPTRNHVGAPVLKQVGSAIKPSGRLVPFSFFVDEQAAAWIAIYDSKGNPVMIARNGTYVRGHRYSGTPVQNLHLVILRPGTINTNIRVGGLGLKPGQTYKIRITTVDFDGHKTTHYASFKA